jgi:hypothetical protein
LEAAEAARLEASLWTSRVGKGGLPSVLEAETVGGGVDGLANFRPVITAQIRRTKAERHNIVLDTRAGLECHVKNIVPVTRTMRLVVIIRIGGSVRRIHRGVTRSIRMKRIVRAGLVVAEVAVLWVDRKSVSSKRGSRRVLHLDVKPFKVSTISSKVF